MSTQILQQIQKGNLLGFTLTVESVQYSDYPHLSQVAGNDGSVPVFRVNELSDYWQTKTEALLRKVPKDEMMMRRVFASSKMRNMWYVTEQGLYRLLFKSKHPDADIFLRWVTYEVLPSLRKSGLYAGEGATLPSALMSAKDYMALRGITGHISGFGHTVAAVCRHSGLTFERPKHNCDDRRFPVAALDKAAEGKTALRGPLCQETAFRTFTYAKEQVAS
jgi:hypothetical protein